MQTLGKERSELERPGVQRCTGGARKAGGVPGLGRLSPWSAWLRGLSPRGAKRRQQHLHPRGARQVRCGRLQPSARLPEAPFLASQNLANGAEGLGLWISTYVYELAPG